MTVSNTAYLRGYYEQTKSMGQKVVSSDFAFEIEGFENKWLLCKQTPWPTCSPTGEIEIPTPLGAAMWQPQQLKVNQQGSITLMETVAGDIDDLMVQLIVRSNNARYGDAGATFNATVYEGTPDKFIRAKKFNDAFIVLDNPDRDWENRSQILQFTGTLFFHYFADEDIMGNSKNYR